MNVTAHRPTEFGSPYATHLEVTVACAVRSGLLWPSSQILELGCGDYSTPALAAIASAQNRNLQVVSSDPVWAVRFAHLSGSLCEIRLIEKPQWPTTDFDAGWGMVLVDNEQRVIKRRPLVLRLAAKAKIIVLHDSNALPRRDVFWKEAHERFQYVYHFRRRLPHTAVFSDHVDPAPWFTYE